MKFVAFLVLMSCYGCKSIKKRESLENTIKLKKLEQKNVDDSLGLVFGLEIMNEYSINIVDTILRKKLSPLFNDLYARNHVLMREIDSLKNLLEKMKK